MTTFSPRILVTGGHGQLGTALMNHARAAEFSITACSREELDICQPASIQAAIVKHMPDLIINAAAYTAVDKAEEEASAADHVNHIGAAQIALACQKNQIKLIHISTDYVFDGCKSGKYHEEDDAHPINIYGKTKWQGEQAVREYCPSHVILRVSGVFSEYGNNFVKTMLKLARERTALNVVKDQITCPTYAGDIANALFAMSMQPDKIGTFHYCSAEAISWQAFAQEIIDEALKYEELTTQHIKPVTTAEYPTAAKRPPYSVLDCGKTLTSFQLSQPSWRDAIKQIIPKLAQEKTR